MHEQRHYITFGNTIFRPQLIWRFYSILEAKIRWKKQTMKLSISLSARTSSHNCGLRKSTLFFTIYHGSCSSCPPQSTRPRVDSISRKKSGGWKMCTPRRIPPRPFKQVLQIVGKQICRRMWLETGQFNRQEGFYDTNRSLGSSLKGRG